MAMAEVKTFADVEDASAAFGRKFARHLAFKRGKTMLGYTEEQEKKLTSRFRLEVQLAWTSTNGYRLNDEQLNSLEETFSRNFGTELGTVAGM